MAKKKRKLTAWQRHVKSYMATHPGLSFKEALPKAKLTYRAGSNPATKKRRKSRNPRASKKPRKVKRKMARRKRRISRKLTIPLAPIAGIIGSLSVRGGSGVSVIDAVMAGDFQSMAYQFREKFAGVDAEGKFQLGWITQTYTPILVGFLVHKVAGILGINRMLGRYKIPLIRI